MQQLHCPPPPRILTKIKWCSSPLKVHEPDYCLYYLNVTKKYGMDSELDHMTGLHDRHEFWLLKGFLIPLIFGINSVFILKLYTLHCTLPISSEAQKIINIIIITFISTWTIISILGPLPRQLCTSLHIRQNRNGLLTVLHAQVWK